MQAENTRGLPRQTNSSEPLHSSLLSSFSSSSSSPSTSLSLSPAVVSSPSTSSISLTSDPSVSSSELNLPSSMFETIENDGRFFEFVQHSQPDFDWSSPLVARRKSPVYQNIILSFYRSYICGNNAALKKRSHSDFSDEASDPNQDLSKDQKTLSKSWFHPRKLLLDQYFIILKRIKTYQSYRNKKDFPPSLRMTTDFSEFIPNTKLFPGFKFDAEEIEKIDMVFMNYRRDFLLKNYEQLKSLMELKLENQRQAVFADFNRKYQSSADKMAKSFDFYSERYMKLNYLEKPDLHGTPLSDVIQDKSPKLSKLDVQTNSSATAFIAKVTNPNSSSSASVSSTQNNQKPNYEPFWGRPSIPFTTPVHLKSKVSSSSTPATSTVPAQTTIPFSDNSNL
jgi:hypothetical protein